MDTLLSIFKMIICNCGGYSFRDATVHTKKDVE